MNEKERLTRNIGQTQTRLKRAAKLTTGLADEKIRWTESVLVHEYNNKNSVFIDDIHPVLHKLMCHLGAIAQWQELDNL